MAKRKLIKETINKISKSIWQYINYLNTYQPIQQTITNKSNKSTNRCNWNKFINKYYYSTTADTTTTISTKYNECIRHGYERKYANTATTTTQQLSKLKQFVPQFKSLLKCPAESLSECPAESLSEYPTECPTESLSECPAEYSTKYLSKYVY